MNRDWSSTVLEYASTTLSTVREDALLGDVQKLLEERDITAAPVIDASGALVGIVSTTDLLRVARIEMASPAALARVWPPPHKVSDVMHKDVVTVGCEASLMTAAKAMVERRIHRVIVADGRRPVGVLTTRDVARAILGARVTDPLSTVMSTELLTVGVGDSIDVAIGTLTDANVRGLVVVDGSWPVGVFTQREALLARALPSAMRRGAVEQVMSYETICHDVKTPLFRVAGQMSRMAVRRILAVDERRLVGIASGFDLVRFLTL